MRQKKKKTHQKLPGLLVSIENATPMIDLIFAGFARVYS
jgi:hypothetical protein